MKQKKAIVFFSAGLGDSVLLIPLVRALQKKGFHVTGLFNSRSPCEDIFYATPILDRIAVCSSKIAQVLFAIRNFLAFDKAYINYFAGSRGNLFTSIILAKKININRKVNSWFSKLVDSKIKYIKPIPRVHDAEQNLRLTGDPSIKLSLDDLFIDVKPAKIPSLPTSFITLQISAGNNAVTYKNWPIAHWIGFLKLFFQEYPGKKVVMIGDKNETALAEKIVTEFPAQVTSLIGKTSIADAMNVLSLSELFIGLDGGPMHLAAALKKPSFTIWGPSNADLYGYERLDPRLHRCAHLTIACRPCSAWIDPNRTRVTAPELCPDHACMQQLTPTGVYKQFQEFFSRLQDVR